jgi:hypothetical protein
MIRKSTWIVLGVFLVLAVAAIFIRWSPSSPIKQPTATPVSTAMAYALAGITSTDVNALTLESVEGKTHLVRNADLTWTRNDEDIVEAGKVEELLANILTMRVLAELAPDYSLDSVGLNQPTQIITIETSDRAVRIAIGGLTPTGTGNYLQIDSQPVIVVSKYSIETILQTFANAVPSTPTPDMTELTPTP